MVLCNFSRICLVLLVLSTVSCCSWLRFRKNPKDKVSGKSEFSRIFSLTTHPKNPIGVKNDDLMNKISKEIPKDSVARKKFVSTTRVLLSLVLGYGMIPTSDNIFKDVTSVVNGLTTTADDKTVATALSQFIVPAINRGLDKDLKKKLVWSGRNPITVLNSDRLEHLELGSQGVTFGCKVGNLFNSLTNLATVVTLKFDDAKGFEEFKQVLSQALKAIDKGNKFTDVDQLIKFVSEFKTQNSNLENFYESYQYKFRTSEDSSIFSLENLFNKVGNMHAPAKTRSYLISAFNDIPTKGSTNGRFFLPHVAGAFKISYRDSKLEKQDGFIIIDLHLGLTEPIILMIKRSDVFNHDTVKVGTSLIKFYLTFDGSHPLAVAKVFEGSTTGTLLSQHKYYLENPICVFAQDTYKPNLLTPFHGILNRQPDGLKSAQLSFQILPKELMEGGYQFNILSGDGERKNKVNMITFTDIFNGTKKSILDQEAPNFGVTSDELWGKMVALKMLLFDDDNLVKQVYELNKKFQAGDYEYYDE